MPDFSKATQITLSSYPRSGNTFLRTILFQCFGLRSTSIYPNDLVGNAELESYVGHIERSADGTAEWPAGNPEIWKVHDLRDYDAPTIYIVRNGRDAVKSLHRFYGGQFSLEDIIKGNTPFGTWSNHVRFWRSRNLGKTLFLRYEDLTSDLEPTLETLSGTLGRTRISSVLPDREALAGITEHWVRSASDRPTPLTGAQDALFQWVNGDVMRELGYR